MYFMLIFPPITYHNLEFTSSFHYQRRRSVSPVCKTCTIFFCIPLFFGSPLCLIMEKMIERSYSNVVSGNGKFISAVSTGCLFGVCCNLCASDFTWPREIICLSGSSDSDPVVIIIFGWRDCMNNLFQRNEILEWRDDGVVTLLALEIHRYSTQGQGHFC